MHGRWEWGWGGDGDLDEGWGVGNGMGMGGGDEGWGSKQQTVATYTLLHNAHECFVFMVFKSEAFVRKSAHGIPFYKSARLNSSDTVT